MNPGGGGCFRSRLRSPTQPSRCTATARCKRSAPSWAANGATSAPGAMGQFGEFALLPARRVRHLDEFTAMLGDRCAAHFPATTPATLTTAPNGQVASTSIADPNVAAGRRSPHRFGGE